MKLLIIGAGSLGTLFGTKLALDGNQVSAFTSSKHVDNIRREGWKLTDIEGNVKKIPNMTILEQIPKGQKYEYLQNTFDICIIATKVYDLDQVCQDYAEILSNARTIVLLQNGLGNEDKIVEFFPKTTVIRIISSNGAILKNSGHVIHTGNGLTKIGQVYPPTSKILDEVVVEFIDELEKAGLNPTVPENFPEALWEKLFINVGINAFGALTRLRNGVLLESPILIEKMKQTVEEAIVVARKMKIHLDPSKNYCQIVVNVLHATKANKNSMLQDILKGSITEVDYLNGKIVDYGNIVGVETPLNDILTELIKGLEKSLKQ